MILSFSWCKNSNHFYYELLPWQPQMNGQPLYNTIFCTATDISDDAATSKSFLLNNWLKHISLWCWCFLPLQYKSPFRGANYPTLLIALIKFNVPYGSFCNCQFTSQTGGRLQVVNVYTYIHIFLSICIRFKRIYMCAVCYLCCIDMFTYGNRFHVDMHSHIYVEQCLIPSFDVSPCLKSDGARPAQTRKHTCYVTSYPSGYSFA